MSEPEEPAARDRVTRESGASSAGVARDRGRPTAEAGAGPRDRGRVTLPSIRPPAPPPPPADGFPVELDSLITERRPAPYPRGGQALLYEAVWKQDGTPVVVKQFDRGHPELEEVWARWRRAEHEHVIKLLYAANHEPRAYEVMQRADHGSLLNHFGPDRPLDEDRARAVLRQIGSALNYIHATPPPSTDGRSSAAWVHLDVKPSNILVTSLDPFTVTLADFGASRVQEQTRERADSAMTAIYAAPELFRQIRSPSADWWALGMTLLEALIGRHPFVDEAGRALSELEVNILVYEDVVLDVRMPPEPWRALLHGLLTRNERDRWTYQEIDAWPTVRSHTPRRPPEEVGGFPFAGEVATEPRELAALMARHWKEAGDLLSGTWGRLLSWADAVAPDTARALRTVEAEYALTRRPIDRTICEVIARLDARAAPVFRGRPAHLGALLSAVRVATTGANPDGRRTAARAWIARLFETRALVALGRQTGHEDLATADENWQRWYDRAQEEIRRHRIAEVPRRTLLQPMLLAAALDRLYADRLRERAEALVNRRNRHVSWFSALRSAARPPDEPAYHALITLTAALAADRRRATPPRPDGPPGPEAGQLALQLRQQVDAMLDPLGGDWLPLDDARHRRPDGGRPGDRLRLEPAMPYRPPYDLPAPPRIGPRAAVGVALLAVTAFAGTAWQTSIREGAAVGAVLLAASAALGLGSSRRSTRLAAGLLGALAGALLGAPIAAGIGAAAGLVAGPVLAWPVFWTGWMLAVVSGAVLGAGRPR